MGAPRHRVLRHRHRRHPVRDRTSDVAAAARAGPRVATTDDPELRLAQAVAEIGRVTAGRARTGVSHDDADGVSGTIETDDAIGFDPFPLLRAFHAHGARVVVMGQVAGILHGSTELTGDLDLLWDGDALQSQRMADAFASGSADLADADGRPVGCSASSFLLPKVLFRTGSASGDCCTPLLPWRGLDIAGFLERAARWTCRDGTVISYVSAADLVIMRRAVGRPKDLRRAAELEAILGRR